MRFAKVKVFSWNVCTQHFFVKQARSWSTCKSVCKIVSSVQFDFLYPSLDSSIGSTWALHLGGPGSNPGKGDNFSMKISNQFIQI